MVGNNGTLPTAGVLDVTYPTAGGVPNVLDVTNSSTKEVEVEYLLVGTNGTLPTCLFALGALLAVTMRLHAKQLERRKHRKLM